MRVIVISSSEGLLKRVRVRVIEVDRALPAWFVFTRRHRRDLGVNRYGALERSFRLRFCHFCVYLGYNPNNRIEKSNCENSINDEN